MSKPIRVILVTDGDDVAKRAIEVAAKNLNLRCISLSAGSNNFFTGEELVNFIKEAKWDPVLVMFDDGGKWGEGNGEQNLLYVANHPDINVIGALAVASNGDRLRCINVDCSIDNKGNFISSPIDKHGEIKANDKGNHICGDTVGVLNKLNIPIVIGIGDLGKMNGADKPESGAPITTAAIKEILKRSGISDG
ncbi:MAG TPA: stage V sporulation protein AE [Clostridia bacterium]|nr:stage V sporulation protein AE [Clostridia bacterium]